MQEAITQAHTLIDQATNILIVLQKDPGNDALASALGLCSTLASIGKKPQIVAHGIINEQLAFLPHFEHIGQSFTATSQLTLTINTDTCPISAVAYNVDAQANKLAVTLDTDIDTFNPDTMLTTELIPGAVDLLITIGVSAIEQLGELQEKDPRLVFDTPIISIDNNPNNTQFGQVHLHKITSASLAELVCTLLQDINKDALTNESATALLTGIVSATRNFESSRTTPDSFRTASVLLEHGADQQKIIKHLYRTKSIALLKLWGRALGKLTTKPDLGVVYTYLIPDDFVSADASAKQVGSVVDEIATSVKNGNLTLLLWQTEEGRRVRGIAYNGEDTLKRLAKPLNGVLKNGKLVFRVQHRDFEEAEKHVFDLLKELL